MKKGGITTELLFDENLEFRQAGQELVKHLLRRLEIIALGGSTKLLKQIAKLLRSPDQGTLHTARRPGIYHALTQPAHYRWYYDRFEPHPEVADRLNNLIRTISEKSVGTPDLKTIEELIVPIKKAINKIEVYPVRAVAKATTPDKLKNEWRSLEEKESKIQSNVINSATKKVQTQLEKAALSARQQQLQQEINHYLAKAGASLKTPDDMLENLSVQHLDIVKSATAHYQKYSMKSLAEQLSNEMLQHGIYLHSPGEENVQIDKILASDSTQSFISSVLMRYLASSKIEFIPYRKITATREIVEGLTQFILNSEYFKKEAEKIERCLAKKGDCPLTTILVPQDRINHRIKQRLDGFVQARVQVEVDRLYAQHRLLEQQAEEQMQRIVREQADRHAAEKAKRAAEAAYESSMREKSNAEYHWHAARKNANIVSYHIGLDERTIHAAQAEPLPTYQVNSPTERQWDDREMTALLARVADFDDRIKNAEYLLSQIEALGCGSHVSIPSLQSDPWDSTWTLSSARGDY
jgi:hypothetical protein